MSTTRTRRAALMAATVTAALVLAACGDAGSGHESGHSSPSSSAASHNAQDVSFAQGMIPHHRQALEMAELAADRASSAEVKDLAARIEKAQDPEIETMSGWLKSWGEETPGMEHNAHSGMPGMPGMMDGAEMTKLEKASGDAFDALFLKLMVEHHEGAVDMAETEKAKGKYRPATAMADDIVTAQTAEIEEMDKLLGDG
ncbi:DUF305 domain-containing protein [Streptomyces sp. S3(2020)]|uniref:DUF305 domain-containing protein n=1 Tax=Streptomyces sp. S3(2020) TaxID=2732044 RepID=UPI00148897BF|nr:DUF305 domain-containing protein [Streptomyces sp. S3(2020)]NNN38115.1 DUF305 domain-containing protein [Streptomyces sp. S3(2020)]